MKKLLYISTLLLFSFSAQAQDKLLRTIQLENTVVTAGVDRPGDLYVLLSDGTYNKYDKNGHQIATRKLDSPPTLFDPRDGTKSFSYYRDKQTLMTLSADMSMKIEMHLLPEFAVNAWLVCPSKNELWILDGADLSLKQTTESGTTISYDVQWGAGKPENTSSIIYMREYLNFLFVLDKNSGIHMFNNLGKPIRRIAEGGIPWFAFLGEELYYPKRQSLHMLDLYTGEARDLPLPRECKFALITDERMILVNDNSVDFFEFKPN